VVEIKKPFKRLEFHNNRFIDFEMLTADAMLTFVTPGSTLEFIGNTFENTKVGYVTKITSGAGIIIDDNQFINNHAPDFYVDGLFNMVNIPIVRSNNFLYQGSSLMHGNIFSFNIINDIKISQLHIEDSYIGQNLISLKDSRNFELTESYARNLNSDPVGSSKLIEYQIIRADEAGVSMIIDDLEIVNSPVSFVDF
jgi:hypothetical protein